jgi:hypothetical protein
MCLVELIDRRLPWTGGGNPGIVPMKVSGKPGLGCAQLTSTRSLASLN